MNEVAGDEAALGITKEAMRELIKPLVLLMHRNRLLFVTIKLNNGIATVSTVKPPNARTQRPGASDAPIATESAPPGSLE